MTDVVEELAKCLSEIRYDPAYPIDKAGYKAQAKEILTFLQPYITEKDKLAKKLWVKRMSRDPETGEITWCELHDKMGEPAHGEAVYVLNEQGLAEKQREAWEACSESVSWDGAASFYHDKAFEQWQAEQKGKV